MEVFNIIIEKNVHLTPEIENEIVNDIKTTKKKGKTYYYKKYKNKYDFSTKTMMEIFNENNLTKNDFDITKKYRAKFTGVHYKKYNYMSSWNVKKLFKIMKMYDIKFFELSTILKINNVTLRNFLWEKNNIRFRDIEVSKEFTLKNINTDFIISNRKRNDLIIDIIAYHLELNKEEFLNVINEQIFKL